MPLLADGLHNPPHALRSWAVLIHWLPTASSMSSLHLLLGLPLSRFPSLGVHSDVIFAHLVFFILATCPAHCPFMHFTFDTLSLVMFTAAVENIFMRMNIETGININGVGLSNLRFADDIILFAESEDKLKEMLEELNNEGKKDGMKLNKKKTKIMCNEVARRRPRTGVKIDAEQLEEVTEYKYLGRLITSGNELSKEIGERITSGWRRFGDYSHFLRDKKIPTCLKRKIMDTVILPAMTYGAETWTLTKHLERKLAVAQRSMERSLLNITRKDKIRNEIIRSKTGVIDITQYNIWAK